MTDWDAASEWAAGEVREGRALHRLVAEELDDAQREALRRVALVVLRPHALEAGRGAAIVRHLAAELGARPVAIRVLPRLEPALVGALYARQPKIPPGRMWLQEAAYGSGPAAALLVACDEAPEPSLTERLYALKGPTSALVPAPGSLRERFGRTSSLHAVLHIPDDLRSLVLEASLFFSWAQLRAAGSAAPIDLDLADRLVTLEPLPGRIVFAAVVKVKLRILAAVAVAAGREVVGALWDLTTRADEDLAQLAYLDQRATMLAFARDEHAPLAAAIDALAAQPRPCRLLRASWLLSGHEPCGDGAIEQLFADLDAGGVPLSASQRSLLATALSTDLHPAARVAGERLWPLGPDPAA